MGWKKFIRNGILLLVGMTAILAAFSVTSKKGGAMFASPEVRAIVENKMVELDGASVVNILAERRGKPQLLFIYASWCPYCKRQFGTLNKLHAAYGQSNLHFDYISVDDDAYVLANFLHQTYPELPFTPFHSTLAKREDFYDALRARGFKTSGAIPFLAVLDAEGNIIRQFEGLTEMTALMNALDAAVKTTGR